MPIYFIQSRSIQNGQITLSGELAHHIGSVLRGQSGEEIALVDENRVRYRAILERTSGNSILAKIIGRLESISRRGPRFELVQSILKGDRMAWLIQKATELGADEIYPVVTERTIARPRPDREVRQRERWQKIAAEAAQQCGRLDFPVIEKTTFLDEFMKSPSRDSLRIIPWEGERELSIRSILKDLRLRNEHGEPPHALGEVESISIQILVGPEGGFTPSEVQEARAAGWRCVTLGPRILRSETAGMATLAILQYELSHER